MQELKERIVKEGKVLPGNIIKVDGFLNHRIDTGLLTRIAELWFSLADRRRQVRRGTGGRPSRAAKGKIRPPPTEALSSSRFLCN